jgi:TM2 domain-containing membrane protein YozV
MLYFIAVLLVSVGIHQFYTKESGDGFEGEMPGVSKDVQQVLYLFWKILPALLVSAFGGAIQYLADIRWALNQRLDDTNA